MRALLTEIASFAILALVPVAAESTTDIANAGRAIVSRQRAQEHAYTERLRKLRTTSRGRHRTIAASSD